MQITRIAHSPLRLLFVSLSIFLPISSQAIAGGSDAVLRSLARYYGKESLEEAADQVARVGGRELFDRAAAKVSASGSEELLQRVSSLTLAHGPDVLRAVDNLSTNTAGRVLRMMDDLSPDQVRAAAKRLSAGKHGREVAGSALEHGTGALKAEIAHPGLGPKLIRAFGGEGTQLVVGLTEDHAIALARHSDELAALPAHHRTKLLQVIQRDKEAFFRWLGTFVSQNPGKVVFSATTSATLIASADNVFGGQSQRINADGSVDTVRVPGLLDALIDSATEISGELVAIGERLVKKALTWFGLLVVGVIAWVGFVRVRKYRRVIQIARACIDRKDKLSRGRSGAE